MAASRRDTDSTCPACGDGGLSPIFNARVPVDVGKLFDSPVEARNAPVGEIDLVFCHGCAFVHNRRFDPDKLSFEPGYDGSLIHSPLFRSFINDVATRLIDR